MRRFDTPRSMLLAMAAIVAIIVVVTGAVIGVLLGRSGDDDEPKVAYLGLTVSVQPGAVGGGGLRVTSVADGSPADQAGIRSDDVLRSVGGRVVRTPAQLAAAIEAKNPGDVVSLTYERGDTERHADVKLGTASVRPQVQAPLPPGATPGWSPFPVGPSVVRAAAVSTSRLGVTAQLITPELQQRYNLRVDSGVVLIDVSANSPASAAGLQSGDVILSFNATAITTPGELLRAVNTAIADREVEVRIRRGTDLLTLKATVTTPVPDLSGLEGLLPPDLRDRLSRAYNDGLLGQDLVQQLRNLYSASSGNVLAGAVKSTTTTSVTIALASGEERTLTLSPDALLQRGGSQIRLSDLRQGETVLAVSNNGGQSFFLIYAFQ